jgi:hypothetical protein
MSGAVRAGILFGIASVLAFVGAIFLVGILSVFAFVIAFGSVIALGWGAGYTAAKSATTPGSGVGRGASAGAISGTINLILLTIALVVLFNLLLSIPGFREQLNQAIQQNPEAAGLDPETALGIGGVFLGGCLGFINLVLMVIAGLIGGAMWKGTPGTQAQYMPAGSSTYTPPPTGTTYGGQPYGSTPSDTEGGARIYDPNDPNRPQQ